MEYICLDTSAMNIRKLRPSTSETPCSASASSTTTICARTDISSEIALQPREPGLTMYWNNGKVATTDVAYAETKEQLGDILIREARDLNHAVRLVSPPLALSTDLDRLRYGGGGFERNDQWK